VVAPSTCMVQRSLVHCFTFIHYSFTLHSPLLGRPVLLPPVPPIWAVSLFRFGEG
jgi:hypothetical protein